MPRPGWRSTTSGVRITPGINRRLHVFAITQIALSFVLLAGAGMLLSALIALQQINTGYELGQVLAIDVPLPIETPAPKAIDFAQQATQKIGELPGVERVSIGNFVPWRDVTMLLPAFAIAGEGYSPGDGEEHPRARIRNVAPGFFDTLGIPIVAGRDFTDEDRLGGEPVAMVSQSVAQRLFPTGDAVNRHMWWSDPLFGKPTPRRIVGVVADVDDEHIVPGPAMTVYHPYRQVPYGGRLFVRTAGDPYALVPTVTQIIQAISSEQPVERAATLADVRTEVLGPDRLNAFVFSAFAGVALLIAVVGVAGVLAFSVSARMHEFGVRLAIGSSPWRLLASVLREGAHIVTIGIGAGVASGYVLGRVSASSLNELQLPGVLTVLAAAAVLTLAAFLATLLPAARASRVDVLQALRAE